MMTCTPTRSILVVGLALLATITPPEVAAAGGDATVAAAAGMTQNSIDDIQRRFKERYRDLFTLKVEGKVGETSTGMVAFVAAAWSDDRSRALVDAENRDRKRYYELLSDQLKARAKPDQRDKFTPALVARRNAARKLEGAGATEYFRMADGVWIRKRGEAAHKRLLKLKSDGIIGEAADGFIAVRVPDGNTARLIEQENDRRKAFYDRIARLRRVPNTTVAVEHARVIRTSGREGDWFRSAQGKWARLKRR